MLHNLPQFKHFFMFENELVIVVVATFSRPVNNVAVKKIDKIVKEDGDTVDAARSARPRTPSWKIRLAGGVAS